MSKALAERRPAYRDDIEPDMLALQDTTPGHLDATLVARIYAGRALGCIVRGLVSEEALALVIAALPESRAASVTVDEGASILGCMLGPTARAPSGPRLEAYLAAAATWWEAPIDETVRPAILTTLAALAGVPAVIPLRAGQRYAPATVRTFEEGAGAPVHCDSYPPLDCHAHLREIVDRSTQLSWYLVLALPDAGGELTLFDHQHGAGAPGDAQLARRHSYRIAPGDLVVFDGGRYFHRIEPTVGPRPRRTLGGFAGRALDGSVLYVWG